MIICRDLRCLYIAFNVPDGGGHILISYPYIKKVGEHDFELTNFEGKVTVYHEARFDEMDK